MPVDPETSSELYRELLDRAVDLVTMIDDQGQVIYQASSVEGALGYQPEDIIGRSIFDFLHPADVELAMSAFNDLMSGLDRDRIVLRLRDSEDHWHYFEVVGRPHEHEGRRTMILNSRNVTGFQEMVEQLRVSERLLHAAFNTTNAICSISNLATGEFIDVNDAWVRASGYSKSEAIGHTAVELGIWGDADNRGRFTRLLREQGVVHQFPTTTIRRDGKPISLLVDAEVVVIDDQELLFLSCEDVTERDQREAQLRQSQRMEAIAQLTGGIAHDLNNMLTVVLGQIDLALNRPLDAASFSDSLSTIRKATTRGSELIRQLMIFSRKQVLKPSVISVNDTINNMVPLLEGSLGGEVTIEVDLAAEPTRSFLDESLLESALLNLCLNGRDAMPRGGHLWISSSRLVLDEPSAEAMDISPGEYLKVEVRDEGIGMDEASLANAFEPYFTTKAIGQGTGLGLSMVFGFVTQSGGHVTLNSTPGNGTTATMLLPTTKRPGDRTLSREELGSSLDGRHVLVVEDNDELRNVIRMLLGSFGCTVTECNGSALPEITSPVDVILSDIVLPGTVQGPELAEAALTQSPEAGLIFMSGYPRERFSDMEAVQVRPLLRKPFSREELKQALGQALQANPN